MKLIGVLAVIAVLGTFGYRELRERQEDQAIIGGEAPTDEQVQEGISAQAALVVLREVCRTGIGAPGFPAYEPQTPVRPLDVNYEYREAQEAAYTPPLVHPTAWITTDTAQAVDDLPALYFEQNQVIEPAPNEMELVICVSDAPNDFCRPDLPIRLLEKDRILLTLRAISTGAEVATYDYVTSLPEGSGCEATVRSYAAHRGTMALAFAAYAKTP